MGRKQRALWEGVRREIAVKRHCAAYPHGCPRMMWQIDVNDPIVCHLNSADNIRSIPPPYEVWFHNLTQEFVGDHECGWDCGVRPTRQVSGQEGLSLFEKIKMAITVEEIAERISDMRGSHTLTGPCPFHKGSGREFVVWTEIQEWKCYGRCQSGGDVIHLIYECKKAGLEWAIPQVKNLERLR